MFNFDKSVELALRTWYPVDHELHYNPHHPLIKLTGEWGELLDDYAKSVYKPNYEFNPIDELGDVWYYIRILCYQNQYGELPYKPSIFHMATEDIDFAIATAIFHSSEALCSYFRGGSSSIFYLDVCFTVISKVAKKYNITLQELTDSNWEKLKPGSVRGEQWKRASREKISQSQTWERERGMLLDMTRSLDEHPPGYEGPCLCKLCCSYA